MFYGKVIGDYLYYDFLFRQSHIANSGKFLLIQVYLTMRSLTLIRLKKQDPESFLNQWSESSLESNILNNTYLCLFSLLFPRINKDLNF